MKIKPLERCLLGWRSGLSPAGTWPLRFVTLPGPGSAAPSGGWGGRAQGGQGPATESRGLLGHRFEDGSPERDLEKAVSKGLGRRPQQCFDFKQAVALSGQEEGDSGRDVVSLISASTRALCDSCLHSCLDPE